MMICLPCEKISGKKIKKNDMLLQFFIINNIEYLIIRLELKWCFFDY